LEYISDLKRTEVADCGGFKVIVKAMRKFRPEHSDFESNKTQTLLYETIQLGGCIAIQSVCDERGAGRGKQARRAGADDAVKSAAAYFAKNRPRTKAAFEASRAAAKRMDKKCSIV
jgi:hypothetical protein